MSVTASDRRHAAGLGILSLFVLGVAAWLVGAAVLPGIVPGWRSVVVTSGSMEPGISPGDVVVVSPLGAAAEVGSVVLFSSSTGPVTHRIVGVNVDGTYVTRGDANPASDSTPLRSDQVLGRARLVIPNAGLPTLWWKQGALAPLVATLLLLGVVSAGLAVSLDVRRVGRGQLRRVGTVGVVPTAATLALCLALVGTSTSASTARAAFASSSSTSKNRFAAVAATKYRLRSDGPGDRNAFQFLPLASPATTTATNATLANYDRDRNPNPGLTLVPSAAGLAEMDNRSTVYWYQITPGAVALNGRARLRVWSGVQGFDPVLRGELVVGLYDCDFWPITCTLVGTGSLRAAPWNNGVSTWRETVIELGTINHIVPSGNALAVQVVAGGAAQTNMWLAYDANAYPSALEVLP